MGSKQVTSFDVARLAGVSRSVVSAVLNGTPGIGVGPEKRKAVLDAIRELGYQVDARARGMKTGRSECIAVLGDTDQPMFLQLLAGVKHACAAHGYHVLLDHGRQGASGQDRGSLIDLYRQRKIDGAVTLDETSYADPEWAETVRSEGFPCVSVEGYAERGGDFMTVLTDYGRSVKEALSYMTRDGQAAPAYVQVRGPGKESLAERERLDAYRRWCEEANVEARVLVWAMSEGAGREDELDSLAAAAIADPDCRALLCNWSIGAFAVYRAAWDAGLRIGADVSVMAADDTHQMNRRLVPSLSCMEIPYFRMGERAVELLMDEIGAPAIRSEALAEPGELPPRPEKEPTAPGEYPGRIYARLVPGQSC